MDLETENRIAAMLLKEAAELRRQAQQEGVLAYLRQPTVRGRPNSRFLNATIRGIEQANRAVEVNEMWRARQKELELDNRVRSRSKGDCSRRTRDDDRELSRSRCNRHDSSALCSSSKRSYEDYHSGEEDGLRDEELEKFLQSRAKRGRGFIGSRMDETGPYLPQSSKPEDELYRGNKDSDGDPHHRIFLGPEKPLSWKRHGSSDEESDEYRQKRSKKASSGSKKKHRKHKSKDKSRDKKTKRKEKRRKE